MDEIARIGMVPTVPSVPSIPESEGDAEPSVDYSGAPLGALGMTNEEFEAVRPVPLWDALRATYARQAVAHPNHIETPAVRGRGLIDRIKAFIARWR